MKRKFKLGDRVNYAHFGNGKIIDIDVGNLTTQYLVEFDEENETYLHSGCGKGKDNHCYSIGSNDSKLVKIKKDKKELIKEDNQDYVTRAEFEEFKKSINKPIEKTEDKKETGRVKEGEEYWFIDSCGNICSSCDYFTNADDYRYKTGNYYLTYEECLRAKDIQDILLKYSYRFSKEELLNEKIMKYYIFYNMTDNKLEVDYIWLVGRGTRFFKTQEVCQKAIDEIGYDDYIKYCVRGNIK